LYSLEIIENEKFQELKLQRDIIVMLAFIASSGKGGFDVLLYSASSQRANFLELIIRVLASEMDAGISDFAKSQTFWKERLVMMLVCLSIIAFTFHYRAS